MSAVLIVPNFTVEGAPQMTQIFLIVGVDIDADITAPDIVVS